LDGQGIPSVAINCWICWDPDEDNLLIEFEKMLNDEPNEYKEVAKKTYTAKPEYCFSHTWEIVGRSPVLDLPWYNCKKCGIAKEKYEKNTKKQFL
jgi:hypothetical protein